MRYWAEILPVEGYQEKGFVKHVVSFPDDFEYSECVDPRNLIVMEVTHLEVKPKCGDVYTFGKEKTEFITREKIAKRKKKEKEETEQEKEKERKVIRKMFPSLNEDEKNILTKLIQK